MEIYHILNRGVDKRVIFLDNQDRARFIHDLYEFNDIENVTNTYRDFKMCDVGRHTLGIKGREKKRLVDIYLFCIMDNHYHLLLSPLVENGVSLFVKKLNGGYAKYFNEKYERSGALFQGKYKKVIVKSNAHFMYLPYYIHFNPLDMDTPEWREKKIKNISKAINFLDTYRWSSHLDYCGKKNFSSVIQKDFLLSVFGGERNYEKNIKEWLKNLSDLSEKKNKNMEKIILE